MIKPVSGIKLRAALFFPIALIIWPLVSYNYYLRRIGKLPDEWYWADKLMLVNGWYVA